MMLLFALLHTLLPSTLEADVHLVLWLLDWWDIQWNSYLIIPLVVSMCRIK